MHDAMEQLELAVWAVAEERATADDLARRDADPDAWQRMLDRLVDQTEEHLDAVRALRTDEREQVIDDFTDDLARLRAIGGTSLRVVAVLEPLDGVDGDLVAEVPAEVRLQASWSAEQVVVWAGGPGMTPASNDELADRLEAIGGPALGWSLHTAVPLPSGAQAEALAIPVKESLGWLVSVGGGLGADGVGASVVWFGRVALLGARLVARGSVVPTLHADRSDGKAATMTVRWAPALLDDAEIALLAASMPGPVVAIATTDARETTLAVLGAVVHAIVSEAARMLELPAPPPVTNTTAAVAEAFITRLDGSPFASPGGRRQSECRERLERWARPVLDAEAAEARRAARPARPRRCLVPLGAGPRRRRPPAADRGRPGRQPAPPSRWPTSWPGSSGSCPCCTGPAASGAARSCLSQAEAWELMTDTGADLEAAGFDVRVPALSRRKPAPGLRLFSEPVGESVVGAHQLSNVRWSAVFDDVELTAAEIARLAAEARPLVQARGKWVELDRVDLKEAAAALAERAANDAAHRRRDPAPRQWASRARPSAAASRVDGSGWATDLFERAKAVVDRAGHRARGLRGRAAQLPGRGAGLARLPRRRRARRLPGPRHGPRQDAHRARPPGAAPPATAPPWSSPRPPWSATGRRRRPGSRPACGSSSTTARRGPSADELDAEFAGADIVITTYGTAVRDVEALGRAASGTGSILDEAQAIKNPANETSQQLRRIPARTRAGPHRHARSRTASATSGRSSTSPTRAWSAPGPRSSPSWPGEGETALRALNGILVFRRTKSEPVSRPSCPTASTSSTTAP